MQQTDIGQLDGAAEIGNKNDESEIENYNINDEEIHGNENEYENYARLSLTSARGNESRGSDTSGVSDAHDDRSPLAGSDYGVRFMLTNARSLIPKIDSLTDAFSSLQLHFASITETWFKSGSALKGWLVDIEGRSGIRILHRSRDGRAKKTGGGVAIAFNTSTCNFKTRELKHIGREFEVMCATGRVGKVERRVVVFIVYVPPGMKAADLEKLRELLALEVAAAKQTYHDPIIIVNGDFNHRDVGEALGEVEDFDRLATGPTRGRNTIDLIYTNCAPDIKESATLPPLQAGGGALSDHQCVYAEAEFVPTKKYKWVIQWRRTRNAEREQAFARDLTSWEWANFERLTDVGEMVEEFERVVQQLTEQHFPLARVRRRSNESPWITRSIRRLWKKKIRIYKEAGRNNKWWETDRILQAKINEARSSFVERMLSEGNSGRGFYAATKKLSAAAPAAPWSVKDLFVGQEPPVMAERILDFYGNVAGDAEAHDMPQIDRCDGGLGHFSVERTAELLGASKKTDSRVEGDPLAHLVRCHPGAFAVPISAIYNRINDSGYWPRQWKTEHLTIIPKNPNPADLSECRNISCTSIFSKVLEGVVLLKLRGELTPDPAQYGGAPKCGAEHMLVDIWEKILDALEGGKNAAVLLGVDYEKAFNRMDHAVCITQLQKLGASPGSVSLVRAFLEKRRMTITIDGARAEPVEILRGSPQGSVLGCLLYCITTQQLTDELNRPDRHQYFPQSGPNDSFEPFWEEENLAAAAFLYVDDTTLFDSPSLDMAARHITTSRTREHFDELAVGAVFAGLSSRADDIGMKINQKKTQLLVISPPNGCDTTGSFTAEDGHKVESAENMRLVGFTFGTTPDAGAHVSAVERQYRAKKWLLYHLKEAGFKGKDLFRLYCCYVRSMIEYCSPVYHPLLNAGQSQTLERLHRHAVRVCFGYEVPVEETMQRENIETLEARRQRRTDNFVRKAICNRRFAGSWFPPREGEERRLRARRMIQEVQANTERRFRSPLAYMRRRANDLGLLPGY